MSQAGYIVIPPTPPPVNVIKTVTGNAGGAVGPSIGGNINIVGTNPITVTGNPGTNTETIAIYTATTAQIGAVILATDLQTIAGANNTDAVVPSGLAAKLGAQTLDGVAYGAGTANAVGWTAAGTNGQVLIAATGAAPAFATLASAGGTITFTPGVNTLNLEAVVPAGFAWTVEAVDMTMVVNHGYIANKAGLLTLLLPAVSAVGAIIEVTNMNTAVGLRIAQNAGNTIRVSVLTTTPGVGGSLTSTLLGDSLKLICTTANAHWQAVTGTIGNWSVV